VHLLPHLISAAHTLKGRRVDDQELGRHQEPRATKDYSNASATRPYHRLMPEAEPPLIYYKPCYVAETYFRECLTCGAIVRNEGLHTIYHEQQVSPKRCPKCGLLDIGRHICRTGDQE
jgi:hypothetical protein